MAEFESVLAGAYRSKFESARDTYLKAHAPAGLAARIATLEAANSTFDIVKLARGSRSTVLDAARIHFTLGSRIGLDWLVAQIEQLSVDGNWQAVARTGLRDAAQRIHRQLSAQVLAMKARGTAESRVSRWISERSAALDTWQRILADLRASGAGDFATLSVGIDAVRRLGD